MAQGYQPSAAERDVISKILSRYEESKASHAVFVRRYEKNERSYRGVLERASGAANWRHQMHPPYAFNLLETIVSNTVEMGLRFNARPSPQSGQDIDSAMQSLRQVDTISDLLRHEHRVDDMDYKQRPLYLTAAIGGRGILKPHWMYREGTVRRQGQVTREVDDGYGNALTVPMLGTIEEDAVIHDRSTAEVVDPRDFWTHESAKEIDPFLPGGAQYLFHRCWYSYEQLEMMEAAGFLKGVKYLKDSRDYASTEYDTRESEVFEIEPHQDLIEVLEYWCMERGVVHRAMVGNKMVLLKDLEENPFNHGGYPFVISSAMPQPFSTIGMPEIELISQLQEMLWELMNQRLDNVELINNFILLVRDGMDANPVDFFPGAQIAVEDEKAITSLMPPYQLAELTLHAEAQLKGDLQNVTSAAPFASGTETASVEQTTATGASIVMNAAQQMLMARKYQSQQGLIAEANMRIKNCQQFLTDKRLAHIFTEDGKMAFREIDPTDIQGEFLFELEPMGESQIRQEKRAEASQFLQVLISMAPLFAASGTPLNLKELGLWFFKKWDIDGAERFFSQQPQPAMMQGPGGPSGPTAGTGAPPAGGGPNLGVTSETAVDASSPSATGGMSMSPEVFMQRAQALGGGG